MTHKVWREEDGIECATCVDSASHAEAAREYSQRHDDERSLIDNSEVICVSEIGSEYVERYSVRAEVSVDYYADRMVGP